MSQMLATYFKETALAWNRFWFRPSNPATICLMRILVGLMLLYTHLIWTLELPTFLAGSGVFPADFQSLVNGPGSWAWSHFYGSDNTIWLWGTHGISLLILLAFTIGWQTRVTSILAFLVTVSYANRAGGALFGLDQINGFLTLYLAVGPSGLMYSLDAYLKKRRGKQEPQRMLSTLANVSTRLMQCHLCVVYFFAGLGKLQGATWWDGTAIWGAVASYEYQTLDMTWLVYLPWLVNILTLVSVFWEISYAFLVWPRLTRPLVIIGAVLLHLGIGLCMGMVTFGLIMIIANIAFLPPEMVQQQLHRLRGTRRSAQTVKAESS